MASLAFGIVFDLLGTHPLRAGDPPDIDAEYEPEATVEVLEAAIRRLGHRAVRLGNPHALLAAMGKGELPQLDVALSIAEGYGGRNREAWAPVLLEMAGVPSLGSDALTLTTTLDKAWAHARVAAAGVPVPAFRVLHSAEQAQREAAELGFPLFVKPRWEGTAKGISPSSRVEDSDALVQQVERILRDYRQPALAERFLCGAEYTVTLVGNAPPRALPVLQRALEARTRIGLHALSRHPEPASGWQAVTPGTLDASLEAELGALALRAYAALECLDFARADFRLDAAGRAHFLEMNPLPTFAPDGSFGILAELMEIPLDVLLADVLSAGLARLAAGARRGQEGRAALR
jgi:D-alanine-D-alanine ligase